MSEKMSLPIARGWRGMALLCISHVEKHVNNLEVKDKLTSKDLVAIKGFKDLAADSNFVCNEQLMPLGLF